MTGAQKQETKKNVLDRSQRRTPLHVVVEKIGTASAVVHGDLSKESLKELLMSELSLVSKISSSRTFLDGNTIPKIAKTDTEKEGRLTEEVAGITVKEDERNISQDAKKVDVRKYGLENGEKLKGEEPERTNEEYEIKEENFTTDSENKRTDIPESEENDYEKGKADEEIYIEKNGEVAENEKEQYQGSKLETKNRQQYQATKDEQEFSEEFNDNYQDEEKYYQDRLREDIKSARVDGPKYDRTETIGKGLRKSNVENEKIDDDIPQDEMKKFIEADLSMRSLFTKTHSKKGGNKLTLARGAEGKNDMFKENKNTMKKKSSDESMDTMSRIEEIPKDESSIDETYEVIPNLSYDGDWLRNYLREPLIMAMKEIVEKKPEDPVNYLGFWLLNYRNSQKDRQRKKDLEKQLLERRKMSQMLQDRSEEILPGIILEGKEFEISEERGENIED